MRRLYDLLWPLALSLLALGVRECAANLLIPGIMTETISLSPKTSEYIGFLQSALNETEVEIRVKCKEEVAVEFDLQFVIRTSPCAKEFIVDKRRFSQVSNLLAFYFEEAYKIPRGYHYDSILYYKSKVQKFSCASRDGAIQLFMGAASHQPLTRHNVTAADDEGFGFTSATAEKKEADRLRRKRNVYPGLNRETIDGGAKRSLTSWHPVQRLPIDAIYLLVLKVTVSKFPTGDTSSHEIETEVQWRGPYGYLSAIDYPLLHFYGLMCVFYAALAVTWLVICLRHWRDLLRIQFWIGAVIVVGMVEKAVFYAEYSNMNVTGESVDGLLELAELTSCLKRTMAHVLIIIVSVGFGVVKPRLGSTMNQVMAVGLCYFLFCSLEGLARVSKQSTDAMKERQAAKIPLAFLEIVIAWWIFSSLVNTMRALRLRKNMVKLTLYRHFTNVLGVAMAVAVLYMTWSLYMHIVQYCMKDWKQLWIDTAFWHIFFCAILTAIMILWRPSQNNQRYAFTPLLDNSEDENEDADDELFSSAQAGVYEMVKQRGSTAVVHAGGIPSHNDPPPTTATTAAHHSSNAAAGGAVGNSSSGGRDDKLQDDLKWIEHNIPASLAEALMDEDEERQMRHLEMSKML